MLGQARNSRASAEHPTLGRLGGLAPGEAERGEKALWLAGPGFRASLFHLGALTRLNELGMLAQTGTVGAVAGGSIVAAFLATRLSWPLQGAYRDWPEQVVEPLRGVAGRDVRARSLLWRRRLGTGTEAVLEEHYARELTAGLGGEDEWGPRFVFGASGLTLSGLAAGWEECLEWSLADPSPGGYDERLVAEAIVPLRRDLGAFGAPERAVLENHGYLLADAALRSVGPRVVPALEPLPPLPPHPRWLDPERTRTALTGGRRRGGGARLRPRRGHGPQRRPQARSAELTALLERHRPLLRYDSLECCRAGDAAAICELSLPSRRNSLQRADGTLLAEAGAPGAAGGVAPLELDFLGAEYGDGRKAERGDFLDESGGSLAADALLFRGDDTDVTYGRARRDRNGTVWLQYWLFFYFTDLGHLGLEQHEGGWELIQLRLGPDGEADAATLARRGGAVRLERAELERAASEDGPVVVIYPARGSHAPLPRPGTFLAPVVPDHTDGAGAAGRPRLVAIGDDGPGWVGWPGRWGATRRREYFEGESPRGPSSGPEWWDPAELHRRARPWGEAGVAAAPPPPTPRLRVGLEEEALAAVEYSFPPPRDCAVAGRRSKPRDGEAGEERAVPARLVVAPVDAGGVVGPTLALIAEPGGGGLSLQLPRGREWSAVRAAAVSAGGTSGGVAAADLVPPAADAEAEA